MAHLLNIDIETMTYSQPKWWISKINIETWKAIYHDKKRRRNEYLEQRKQQLHEAKQRTIERDR